jgi:hypothetical protein
MTFAQSGNEGDKGVGVVFKIPNDVFPMDWNKSGFKGVLMLRKDKPSGIFVAYPNDNESMEALRERAAKFILPMFGGDKAATEKVTLQKSSIPVHKGDTENAGSYYLYSGDKTQIQILFYERVANGKSFLYGYFANKNKESKDKDAIKGWADEKGEGVKIFEEFWKTIKE